MTATQAPDGEPHGHPLGEADAVEQTITHRVATPINWRNAG